MPLRLQDRELVERAVAFRAALETVKKEISPTRFLWYPYDSLSAFEHLEKLLAAGRQSLLDLIGEDPVLDVGCADGALSFFLESLGCKVQAIDYGPTNQNDMQGIAALKAALGSSVEIREVDLDDTFALPAERYGLVFFLGVLYHLKNPFYVLESLARRARYCFLSTRVAQVTPDRLLRFQQVPMAYLLAEREVNDDPSNYWIFSEAGLRLLIQRTGWSICGYLTTGDTIGSDPVNPDRDERAFCLLESRTFGLDAAQVVEVGNRVHEDLLGPTWYEPEGGFRWMARRASVRLRGPRWREQKLYIAGYCPAGRLKNGPVRMHVSVDGRPLPPVVLDREGAPFRFCFSLPGESVGKQEMEVVIEVDQTLVTPGDERELGAAFGVFEIR